jgi:DNA-binding CsgD family transcriptional regulator
MTTTPSFHALVERIEGFIPGEDSPEVILALITQTYGISHAAYLGLDLPNNPIKTQSIFYATYPKPWIDHYIENNYIRKDPTVAITLRSTLPIDWSKLPPNDKELKRFFREANDFGIGERGITVPIMGMHGEKGLFTVVGDMPHADWDLFTKTFMPDIVTIGLYVHWMFMKNIMLHDKQTYIKLSPREVLCLEWASNGKTFNDIADILDISNHTVRMYLDTARRKLQCLNITHAVARAIKMGLIRVPR